MVKKADFDSNAEVVKPRYITPDVKLMIFISDDIVLDSSEHHETDPFGGEKGEGPTW